MKIYRIKNVIYHRIVTECNDLRKIEYIQKLKESDENLLSKLKNSDKIFSYQYLNASLREILNFDIFTNYEAILRFKNTETKYTLTPNIVNAFKNIIKKYDTALKSEDYYLEDHCCYDGYLYRIMIFDGEDYYYCDTDNLQVYDEIHPNAYKIVLMLKEIFALLKQAGIEHEEFRFQ